MTDKIILGINQKDAQGENNLRKYGITRLIAYKRK
jgi:hypothetical protein